MRIISNTAFGGERPLFESHDLRLENVPENQPSRNAATSKLSIVDSKGITPSGMFTGL